MEGFTEDVTLGLVLFRKYSCLAALGLLCCLHFSLFAVHRLFIAVASPVKFGLQSTQASVAVACGFSGCSSQAQELWCLGLVAPRHEESSQI